MSGNRRGFIGIFSQNDDAPFDDEVDARDLRNKETEESVSKTAEKTASHAGEAPSAVDAESDWDDIFDEGPAKPAPKESGRPPEKAQSPAATGKPAAEGGGSKATTQKTDAAADGAKGHGERPAREPYFTPSSSTSPIRKTMHHGQSPKSTLSSSDRQAITDALQTLREKLSFTRQVSAEQRNGLMKLGDTGRSFIGQALKVVQETPDILPRSFDDDRFCADVDLADTLRSIAADLNELSCRVADTESTIYSHAFIGALAIHSCGKFDREGSQLDTYRRNLESRGDAAAAMNGAGA